ncbi:hypothetical protein Bca101_012846 [Brassica carinata]
MERRVGKKTKVDLNQSSAAAAVTVIGSHELSGNVQLEVVATESSPRKKKLDDTLPETTRKETEMGVRSSIHKKALIRAQSQPDIDDDSPVDFAFLLTYYHCLV